MNGVRVGGRVPVWNTGLRNARDSDTAMCLHVRIWLEYLKQSGSGILCVLQRAKQPQRTGSNACIASPYRLVNLQPDKCEPAPIGTNRDV